MISLRVTMPEYSIISYGVMDLVLPENVQPSVEQLEAILAKVDEALVPLVRPHMPCSIHLVVVTPEVLAERGRIYIIPEEPQKETAHVG